MFRPFFDPIRKTSMFINPISISLKWPILNVTPLFEKQHISFGITLNIIKFKVPKTQQLDFQSCNVSVFKKYNTASSPQVG